MSEKRYGKLKWKLERTGSGAAPSKLTVIEWLTFTWCSFLHRNLCYHHFCAAYTEVSERKGNWEQPIKHHDWSHHSNADETVFWCYLVTVIKFFTSCGLNVISATDWCSSYFSGCWQCVWTKCSPDLWSGLHIRSQNQYGGECNLRPSCWLGNSWQCQCAAGNRLWTNR